MPLYHASDDYRQLRSIMTFHGSLVRAGQGSSGSTLVQVNLTNHPAVDVLPAWLPRLVGSPSLVASP